MQLSKLKRGPQSREGVWWDFEEGRRVDAPHESHLCVLVAERDNPAYRDSLAKLSIERRDTLKGDDEQWATAWKECQTLAVATGVLLGWVNLDDEDGKPIPYAPDTAAEILGNEGHWPFRQFVLDAAGAADAYRQEAEREALGN